GVSLLGIDSAFCPPTRRQQAWDRLSRDLTPEMVDAMTTRIPLAEVPQWANAIVDGKVRGRVVVDLGE
ncbi:MAG: oxidoreductase, partial [Bryobacteraceae bacterium]